MRNFNRWGKKKKQKKEEKYWDTQSNLTSLQPKIEICEKIENYWCGKLDRQVRLK